jgi:hypothetical protein
MKRILHQTLSLLFVAAALSLVSCNSLVHDDLTECPEGIVIQLVPKYAARTSFEAEMTDVHLAIYDDDTNTRVKDMELSGTELAQQGYQVSVNLPEGNYHVIAWNGLCDTANYSEHDNAVTLNTMNDTTDSTFAPLWHGMATSVKVESLTMETVEVPMVKDTNNFVVYLCATDGTKLNPDDFDFNITAANGQYDCFNNVLDGNEITYFDFSCKNEEIEASLDADLAKTDELGMLNMVRSDINTLRLTTEHPSYLHITQKDGGKNILTLNLNDYILKAFRAVNAGNTVSSQQYFDTEDLFNITVFLTPDRGNSKLYYVMALRINYWIVRFQQADLF